MRNSIERERDEIIEKLDEFFYGLFYFEHPDYFITKN